jgi:hypothetical protein
MSSTRTAYTTKSRNKGLPVDSHADAGKARIQSYSREKALGPKPGEKVVNAQEHAAYNFGYAGARGYAEMFLRVDDLFSRLGSESLLPRVRLDASRSLVADLLPTMGA